MKFLEYGLDLEYSFNEFLKGFGLSSEIAHIIWLPLPMLLVLVAAVVGVLVTVWLERKISAAAQQRIGPEYAGALGVLQPIADGLKLLVKEDIIPAKADGILFTAGPILVLVPVILSWLIVPFGQNLLISNVGIGIFLWIALSSIQPIGLLMSGYASNNKYSLLGGLRAAAQSISYEIPLALSVLAIVLMTNSLSTIDIVNQQSSAGILSWNIWRQPVGFIVFWICALAECERLPFDLPEAEEELVAGYQTEYAGALGVLQPIADGLKLLVKEDIIPAKADGILFTAGPILVLVPVILSWLIVPFGQNLLISNVGIGIFLWIALSSIQPIGLLMSGYASNNKYSLLGGLRAAAQSISYEIPLALSVLAIVLMTNSLSTVDIVNQQSGAGILSWNIWRQPVGFIVFWICALAECERLPFDLPEAEEELVAGYQTEYAGMKFALFYLGSYINLILSALLVSILYLGGWGFPIPVELIAKFLNLPINAPFIQVFTASIGIVMTVLKAYLLVFIAILLRWTTPRVRIDQLLDLGWKFLLPISLANLLITAGLKLAFPQFFGG